MTPAPRLGVEGSLGGVANDAGLWKWPDETGSRGAGDVPVADLPDG